MQEDSSLSSHPSEGFKVCIYKSYEEQTAALNLEKGAECSGNSHAYLQSCIQRRIKAACNFAVLEIGKVEAYEGQIFLLSRKFVMNRSYIQGSCIMWSSDAKWPSRRCLSILLHGHS